MKTIILCFTRNPFLQNINTQEIHSKDCQSLRYAEKKNFRKLTTKEKDQIIANSPAAKCKLCKSV